MILIGLVKWKFQKAFLICWPKRAGDFSAFVICFPIARSPFPYPAAIFPLLFFIIISRGHAFLLIALFNWKMRYKANKRKVFPPIFLHFFCLANWVDKFALRAMKKVCLEKQY